MKPILLMKDYSVIQDSVTEENHKYIQFILFPCDLELNTYLLVEPNAYMLKMKKAKIIIEAVVQRCGYDYKDHYYPIGRIKKIVNTYEELIQYLFSIDKMNFYNKLMQMSEVDEIPPYMTIQYCFFSIRLYDKNDKVIFKKKINIGEEVQLSEIHISEFFSARNILNNIQDIYFSELSLFKEHISIHPSKNKWDLGHDDYKYKLCALWMDETNSISFFHKDDIRKFKYITNIYASGITWCRKDEYGDYKVHACNLPEYDMMYFDFQLIIEYLTYLPYINMVTRMCAKITNQEYNTDTEITEDDFEIDTRMEIDIGGKIHHTRFDDDNPFEIKDLLKLLEES